jgi:broad specificity phosphatase PhoE
MRSQKIKRPLKNKYAVLRHGETDANGQKIYMGRLDFDLNDTGTYQAKETVLPVTPDVVLHSPLKRTKQTADLATKGHTVALTPDERLLEKAGGDIDGLKYAEIAQKYPEVWGIWDDNSLEYIVEATFPGGESDLDVVNRLEDLLVELEATHQGKNILLVTHSGVIQAARYLFGQSKEDIYFKPVPNGIAEIYE